MTQSILVIFSAERKLVQTIREQQDEAYLESLKADQEKERLKRLEEEKFLQQQMEEEAERLAREKRKEVRVSFHLFC